MDEQRKWNAIHNSAWNYWQLAYGNEIMPFSLLIGGLDCSDEVFEIVALLNADNDDKAILSSFICLACGMDGP
jgi:hypothetical protein